MSAVTVIGHRGAAGLAPENTVEAFERACALGLEWVETDVRKTRDGVLVLHHDLLVGGRRMPEVDWADLGSLAPAVPTLRAVLEGFGDRLRFNLELKTASLAAEVAGILSETVCGTRALISSFHHRELLASKALLPDVPHAPLISERPLSLADWLRPFGAFPLVVADAEFVDRDLVLEARSAGTDVWVYNVSVPCIGELVEAGVLGFIVDDPGPVREVLRGSGSPG